MIRRKFCSQVERISAAKSIGNYVEVTTTKRLLKIPNIWAIDADPCNFTKNGQRTIETFQISNTPPLNVSFEPEKLTLEFPNLKVCDFTLDYLLAFSHKADYPHAVPKELWTAQLNVAEHTFPIEDLISGGALAKTPSAYHTMTQFEKFGFFVINSQSTDLDFLPQFAKQLGFIRETNYGSSFAVKSVTNANNLAYTSVDVSPHTDNPYRHPVPGMQLFHCLQQASKGGLTKIVDSFAVAEHLKMNFPDHFQVLSNTEVDFEFRDHEAGVILHSRQPIISVNKDDNITRVAFNNRSFRPPQLEICAEGLFLEAYQNFGKLLCSEEFVLLLNLQPGEVLAVDNYRVCHGRTAFEGERHLHSAYIDIDHIKSVRRYLAETLQTETEASR